MAEWLSISRLVDFILLGMMLEALWFQRHHWGHGGTGASPLIPHLFSGAFLLISMKLALADFSPILTAAVLGIAGLFHYIDVRNTLLPHR